MMGAVIPADERILLQLSWTDCTNVAGGWHDAADLDQFATNGAWEASNTGWLVYEDKKCYPPSCGHHAAHEPEGGHA